MSGATRSADVAVLGAGPAGLAAALGIARSGRSVVVVERDAVPGGLAGSFEVAGVRVDYGSHRLHPSCDPAILGELRRLLGTDLQLRERHGRVRVANRWVAFPPRVGDLARRLPAPMAARLASDVLTAPLRRRGADTFADVVRAGLGPTMLGELYGPYVEKIWGLPPRALDGELARRRVGARSPAALAGKLVRRGDRPGSVFFSPRRGYGQISEALAAAVADAGAELRFGAEVRRMEAQGDRVALTTATGERIDVALVASSIPAPALISMLGDAAPVAVRDAATALEFRGLVLVYLVLARPRWTEFDAHYFPALDTVASRVSEPKNYRDGDDPEDVTVLCAEIPCTAGDATWSAPDEALAARVVGDLARAGLDRPAPDGVTTRRIAKAYPTYRRGFAERLVAVDGWLAAQPRVVTFGRQGLFAHDNAHHALAMGWALAGCLRPDGSLDRQRWGQAREGFRAHVVED